MSKGSYPVSWRGKVHGHDVYVAGQGWVYRPLPREGGWISLAPRERRR